MQIGSHMDFLQKVYVSVLGTVGANGPLGVLRFCWHWLETIKLNKEAPIAAE